MSVGLSLGVIVLAVMTFLLLQRSRRLEREQWQQQLQLEQALSDKHQAQQADKAKSDFLSRMSHELRTPLNAIMGFSQLLKYAKQVDEEHERKVDHILDASDHLLELIDELLDMSRIESGQLKMNMELVDVIPLVDESVQLVRTQAIEHDISLQTDMPAEMMVYADKQRLKQVILNLVNNGVKYNRQGGRVEVRIGKRNTSEVGIAITDTGSGIDEEDINRLFRPFERLHHDASAMQGTGLGLVICKDLMELMHGRIEVESTPDEGSTFTLIVSAEERKSHVSMA